MAQVTLIAEVGWNHMGDMDLAETMAVQAAAAGAHVVKFQTWNVNRLKPGEWDKDGRREIYEKAQLSRDDHYRLRDYCHSVGVKFLTSCFCVDDLEWLRDLTPMIKIPSTECANVPLVRKALDLFDTVYISTGATRWDEYRQWAKEENAWLLHCVSAYPCPAGCVNLPKLEAIREITPRVGYSGHYAGIDDAVGAIALGALVVEKHFTTNRRLPGRDNEFALLPGDFERLSRWAKSLTAMREYRSVDYQEIEKSAREDYAGRWSGNLCSDTEPERGEVDRTHDPVDPGPHP